MQSLTMTCTRLKQSGQRERTSACVCRSGRKRSRREAGVDGDMSDSLEREVSLEEHPSALVDTSARLDVLPEEVDEVPSPPALPAVTEFQLFSPERRFIRSVGVLGPRLRVTAGCKVLAWRVLRCRVLPCSHTRPTGTHNTNSWSKVPNVVLASMADFNHTDKYPDLIT